MMLREKAQRKRNAERNEHDRYKGKSENFTNEVGAWTAALDACGKAGHLDTAIRLFWKMPQHGLKPNVYTCGALTDCLLKSNTDNSLDETLNVLRYMKEEGIEPSEFMYTSLITSASKFAKRENKERGEIVLTDFGDRTRFNSPNGERMKSLDVYTELILSLTSHNTPANTPKKTDGRNQHFKPGTPAVSEELLVKVFLVLQEMKVSGADPDIACYNAILRACSRAGDVSRLRDVLRRIEQDGLIPNSTTWKELLRGASTGRDSTMAEAIWTMALSQQEDKLEESYSSAKWIPQVDEFDLLLSSYIREAGKSPARQEFLNSKVIDAYICVANGEKKFGFHHIALDGVKDNRRVVKMVSQAAAFFRNKPFFGNEDELNNDSLQANIRQIEQDLEIGS